MNKALSLASIAVRPVFRSLQRSGRLLFSPKYLLFTNTGLSVSVSIGGDLIQQNYQRIQNDPDKFWDIKRTGKMAASGLAFGPLVHYWYFYLDKWFPARTLGSLFKKIALDQLCFSPICVTVFLLTIGIIEQQGLELLKEEFMDTGVLMFLTDIVFWSPALAINFYFMPAKYRVLFDNMISLVVDTIFSYLRFDHSKARRDHTSNPKDKTMENDASILPERKLNIVGQSGDHPT
ncbi:unnamed protein product [Lymnaea stagnalis]|uniref:Uncharacterized protein n=1 Tax=Lymnaea stagnalis TaxID=6523 RepID=A0AAV2I4L0_LYMST